MKFDYIVVYDNSSDKFDIGHCWIKMKGTVGLYKCAHIPQHKLNFGTSL